MSEKTIEFRYRFFMPQNQIQVFDIRLDEETLEMVSLQRDTYPEWTRLSHYQCPNCPFREEEHPHCPVARNLVEVIDFCKDAVSHEEVDVEILSEERTYKKRTSLQNALSSLIGIYMPTSGCAILDKLRPLVRTHLPFASMPETAYRTVSMYLLAQYFLMKRGKTPDWNLKCLAGIFDEIQKVNDSFRKRIASVHREDAGLNAVIRLSCYAWFTSASLIERDLEEIEKFFHAYLEVKPQVT